VANRKRKTPAAAEAAPAIVSFQEALAEAGQTVAELRAALPIRQPGTSNLAQTIRAHRAGYATVLHPSGKKTQNNGDIVAKALLWATLPELKDFSGLRFERRYDHLNDGHARMCIGNLLRGALAKGDADIGAFVEGLLARAPKEE
jgi:hypothetical protein